MRVIFNFHVEDVVLKQEAIAGLALPREREAQFFSSDLSAIGRTALAQLVGHKDAAHLAAAPMGKYLQRVTLPLLVYQVHGARLVERPMVLATATPSLGNIEQAMARMWQSRQRAERSLGRHRRSRLQARSGYAPRLSFERLPRSMRTAIAPAATAGGRP
jgi:hypothetical protein